MVDGIGPVGDIVHQSVEHVDVVLVDIHPQRTVGGRGPDVVIGAQVRQVVVMLVGEIPRQGALRSEHADPAVAAQEHRLAVEIAAQRVEGAAADHHPHRVDADVLPEALIATEHQALAGRGDAAVLGGVLVVIVLIQLGGDAGEARAVIGEGFVEFGGGLGGSACVHLGCGDSLIDRGQYAVPAAGDDFADAVPALEARPPGELFDTTGHQAEVRVAVEEPCHRRQFAHRPDRGRDGQGVGDCAHRGLGGLLGQQFLHGDQVGVVVVGRRQLVGVGRGRRLPGRVIGQIVVGVGPHERHQIGHRLEYEEVVILAEEALPFITAFAPAGGPQRVEVAGGDAQPDGNELCSHAAQPNDLQSRLWMCVSSTTRWPLPG